MATIKKKFGQQQIGGGGGSGGIQIAPSNIFHIIGGNSLDWASTTGIKHITTEITSVAITISADVGLPSTLPDGLGWAKSLDSGNYALMLNDSKALTQFDITQQPVLAVETVTLSGASASYTAYRIIGPI
jgi:hypothetical protein